MQGLHTFKRQAVNVADAFHAPMVNFWHARHVAWLETTRVVLNRVQRTKRKRDRAQEHQGDYMVDRVKSMFHKGLGRHWGDNQIEVFQAFMKSSLPLIYGEKWAEEKTRVMALWELKQELKYSLVCMARRTGKTFVTSGAAAALLLSVPGIIIIIFSTCKRTASMMMAAVLEHIDNAFATGTHAQADQFKEVTRNTEQVIFRGPDGSKRTLACYPSSCKVSQYVCVCVCALRDVAYMSMKGKVCFVR